MRNEKNESEEANYPATCFFQVLKEMMGGLKLIKGR